MAKKPAGEGADVQLEHGHVRIANPVMEALAMAPFNAGQLRVMLAVIRGSWGWRRNHVDLSTSELAVSTGLARSTAAAALRDLVNEGAVVELSAPTFNSAGRYRPQKLPSRWGRFAVAPPSLSGTPDTPESRTLRNQPPDSPESRTPLSGTPDTPAPQSIGAQRDPPPLKTVVKDRERQVVVGGAHDADVVRSIVRAANEGMLANPAIDQRRLQPIRSNDGRSQQAVADWLGAGVPPDLVLETVREVAKAFSPAEPGDQIHSMNYFAAPIRKALEKRLAETDGGELSKGDRQLIRLMKKYEGVDLSNARRGIA